MSIGDDQDRPTSETVYLELSEGQSHKFYEVTVIGTLVTIRYGRIGTVGQSSNSTYATPEKAQAEATKKVNEKLRKGYTRIEAEGNRSTSSTQLLADAIQPVVPSPDTRHYWIYKDGWFVADRQGRWAEVNEETRRLGQPWWFRETTRTEEYVEMYDDSRRVTVRLTATAMLVRWDRAGSDASWEEYHKGQWQEHNRGEISSRSISVADLPIGGSGRRVLQTPLERSLVAVELTTTCTIPTFTINLRISSNIAYHFDVRSQQRQIVQNTCINGGWGSEERLPIPAEFTSGQPFILRIAVEETLVVYLNGQVLSRYVHRLLASQINAIEVTYPPDNLQLQAMQVLEQTDVEIAVPVDTLPAAAPEAPALSPAPTRPSSPLPIVDPDIRPPSIELLNQATHGQSFPPSVTRNQLRSVRYPLGFVLRELKYCYLSIPLARSLVCFELVGTMTNVTAGRLHLRLAANQDMAWACDFDPNQGQIVQWSTMGNVNSEKEHISLPSPIVSGQLLHFVLTLTHGNIVGYVNNQPFAYNPPLRPATPPDKLHLNYDTDGFKLQQVRVLEPLMAEPQVVRSTSAISPLPTRPEPRPAPVTAHSTATLPEVSELPQRWHDLPSQFEPLRPFLEANLQAYIKIQVEEEVQWLEGAWVQDPLDPWQSKIGGYPYLPKGVAYPSDCTNGSLMMFLMQINCADLPIIDGLPLPRQGILQFYSGLDVPMSVLSPEQHRIRYFPEISQNRNDLITDFSLLSEFAKWQEWYQEIYPLTFAAQQDVFRVDRRGYINRFGVPQELKSLCDEFHTWLDEKSDRGDNKIGGEVEPNAWETVEQAQGVLLLELNHPDACDDYFYFFIEASDLANLDFSKVESYFRRD